MHWAYRSEDLNLEAERSSVLQEPSSGVVDTSGDAIIYLEDVACMLARIRCTISHKDLRKNSLEFENRKHHHWGLHH